MLNLAKKLQSIADVGLLYNTNEYDRERYAEVREIGHALLHGLTGEPLPVIRDFFAGVVDYPTAKVDIRALVLSADKRKVLLVKEGLDNRWSLPGGWADVGYTPKETAVKECKEETGLDVVPVRLLAVFDKKMHAHPPQPFYVYKLVLLCEPMSDELNKGFDIAGVDYFDMESLPTLSEDRILKSQVELVYRKAVEGDMEVWVD